jgi:hypothetical protein
LPKRSWVRSWGRFSFASTPSRIVSGRPQIAPSSVNRPSAHSAPSRRTASTSTVSVVKVLCPSSGGAWLKTSWVASPAPRSSIVAMALNGTRAAIRSGILAPMSHRLHPAAVARTTDEARRGRSEFDRAVVNDPERTRRATAAILAGDARERERVMREGFARGYEAYNRRDWELNTLHLDAEHIFRASDLREALPDARDEYHDIEGYLEAQELLQESWSDLRLQLVDVLAVDRDQVVSLVRFTGHGRRSDLPLDWPAVIDNRFRDGLVVEGTYWWDARRGARELGVQLPPVRR